MKIAYIVYDYFRSGGIERYVKELAHSFMTPGNEVHIYTTPNTNNHNDTEIDCNKSLHYIDCGSGNFVRRYSQFGKKINDLSELNEFEIVHSQGLFTPYANIITAHSCHYAWVQQSSRESFWERTKKLLNPVHRMFLDHEKLNYSNPKSKLRKIIAVSELVKQDLIRYYNVNGDIIEVIYPGVDTSCFPDEHYKTIRETVRSKLSIKNSENAVVFVANEFRRKGLSTLLQALSLLKGIPWKLIVVGNATPVPYKLISRSLGISKRVLFVGNQSRVRDFYYASDLFVLPTRHDAFGMVITEAMAAGIPVIASAVAGASRLLTEENCVLKNARDHKELAVKISYFLESEQRRVSVAKTLQDTVRDHSWQHVSEETFKVYQQCLTH